jgi:CO/xanthine dehydrogenase FAD-binding subunit
VKPAQFAYRVPATIDDALVALAEAPEDTSVLAGGQSLVPMLNMRLARPAMLVDLNRVQGLDQITVDARGTVRIGAMVRQRELEVSPLIRERLPLLTEAADQIAHIAIRTRGTVGGSLVHADPAAELPAVMAALRARMHLRRRRSERTLAASEFFVASLMTAVEPGELLVAIEVEPLPAGTGWAFTEMARTHGAFALVGVAALLRTGPDGRIDLARLALCGVHGVPYVPDWLEAFVVGQRPDAALFREVGQRISASVTPSEEGRAGEYRRSVSGALAARALTTAAQRAGGEQA